MDRLAIAETAEAQWGRKLRIDSNWPIFCHDRLTRTGARRKPRGNWRERWKAAGAACGWKGALKNEMVALKTSPIWQKIADGEGGYMDTLGSPYPPFAFGSGMAWVSVRRKEWKRLCAAEGAEDGLDAITEKARELKSGQGSIPTAPGKVQVDAPRGVGIPDGSGNPLADAPRQAFTSATVAYPVDFSHRDAANNAIDDAIDEITVYADGVASEIAKAEKAGNIEAVTSLRTLGIELASLRGRVINYGSSVESQPPPTNRIEQSAYDMEMDRYAKSAMVTAKRAEKLYRLNLA